MKIKMMGVRLDILVDVIDMVTRFDENFAYSQKVHMKELLMPPMKFKVLSIFKGPQKPLHKSLGRMRHQSQYQHHPQFQSNP